MNWSISYGKSVPMAEYNNLCTRIDNLSASYTEKRLECERLIKAGNAQRDERDELTAQVGRLREALRQAIPAVRNTAPPGWILVPAEPTPEMIDAALDAHMPLGDMTMAIQCANAEAPEPDQ